jgi:type I restriction enzyme S subunit
MPQEDDIVFSYEATLHRYARVPSGFLGCLGRRMALIRPDTSLVDPRYLHLYLLSSPWRKVVESNIISGATVDRIPLVRFPEFPVHLPDLATQRRVADVLVAYDDLIENNRRRIKLLEDAARLIYREWFVRFRFPGYEHIELETGVPKDWRKAPLGALVAIRKGKNITKETVMEGQVPVVAGGLQPAYFHNTANVPGPAVTVSASGANAGFVNLYHTDIWASDCSYISSDATPNVYFFFLLLRDRHSEIHAMQKGAAQPHVYPKDLERLVVLYPSDALLQEFADLVAPVFRQIRVLQDQSRKLGEARNLLLPRLMSGEVQI